MVLLAIAQEHTRNFIFISNFDGITDFLSSMDCEVLAHNDDSEHILRCPLYSSLSPIYVNIAMEDDISIVGIYFGSRFFHYLETEVLSWKTELIQSMAPPSEQYEHTSGKLREKNVLLSL